MVLALLKILIWPVLIIVGFLVLAQFLNPQAEAALGMSMSECEKTYMRDVEEEFGDEANIVDFTLDRDKEFFDREFVVLFKNETGISTSIRMSEKKTKRVAAIQYQRFDRHGDLIAFTDDTLDTLISMSMPDHTESDFKPLRRQELGNTILECRKHNHRAIIDSTHGMLTLTDDDLRNEHKRFPGGGKDI